MGTKGIIRGNKFNQIVKKYITNLKLNKKTYEICFEKKCEDIEISEIPDWFIKNIKNNKVITGMNQLDLLILYFINSILPMMYYYFFNVH